MFLEQEDLTTSLFTVGGSLDFGWHLSLSPMSVGFSLPTLKMFYGMEKKIEEELGLWDFKIDSFGDLAVNLEKEKPGGFLRAKLSPLRISSSIF